MAEISGLTPPHAASPEDNSGRTLRVLIALNSYQQDGPGNLMFRLCQRLHGVPGLALETVALSRGGELLGPLRQMGVPSIVVNSRGNGGLGRLREWASEVGARPTRPHVVHSNLLWPDLALRLVLGRLGNPPLASTIHGLHAVKEKGWLEGVAYHALERPTRGKVAAFVAISRHVRDTMIAAGYPAAKTHVIPNGVDAITVFPVSDSTREETRHMLDVAEDAPMLVAAGNLLENKGPFVSLEAFARVHTALPESRLVFVGEGPLREPLEAEAARRNLPVRFVGHLSKLLPQVLGSADVVLHPSRTEGFGLIVAEAMATGVPVVAGDTGGVRELIKHGETGMLIDPTDAVALADAVLFLLRDRDHARALGAAARESVVANCEIGRTADAYLELWKTLRDR